MNIEQTKSPELLIVEPKVFADDCGFFLENYNEKAFAEKAGISTLPPSSQTTIPVPSKTFCGDYITKSNTPKES